ncbi:MAG: M1 family metallopeptidase [Bacteroidota bacterium]|nr:M1 family metallopeptidase [Bacteroidota bacterium]
MKGLSKLSLCLFFGFHFSHLVAQEPILLEDVVLESDSIRKWSFRSAPDVRWDVIHLDLEASFRPDDKEMDGRVRVWATPVIAPRDTLFLDAKRMKIEQVMLISNAKPVTLPFVYDSLRLGIPFSNPIPPGDTVLLQIDYVARPEKAAGAGGRAITESKGLFFIDAKEGPNGYPSQIWTQGETTFNSSWIPIIDHPHEKITHRFFLTVPDDQRTLSNGELKFIIRNEDDTRTDVWVMEKPHAPYLAMMAIGPFAEIRDSTSDGLPVNYIVEERFAPYANQLFGSTPKMIEFFSQRLGVPYPWNKYHQVVVREYVSGAMENTTATILGEFLYEDDYSLDGSDHEGIIAHELFHQWFGDLVTCRSWSDISMNEAFASYGEYLWFEHSRGKEQADLYLRDDLTAYLEGLFSTGYVPIVRYHYKDPIELFDRNTYQKGARVLHQLRVVLGDANFFAGLTHYLKDHQFGTVEVDDLRRSFEDVTGQDLRWFFQQWFFQPGHVELLALRERSSETVRLKLHQEQVTYGLPLYRFPLVIEAHYKKEVLTRKVMMEDEWTSLEFPAQGLEFLLVDADHSMLGVVRDSGIFRNEWIAQLKNGDLVSRFDAFFPALEMSQDPGAKLEVVKIALKDPHEDLRFLALDEVMNDPGEWSSSLEKTVRGIAEEDKDLQNRRLAIQILDKIYHSSEKKLFELAAKTKDYGVATAGIIALGKIDKETAYPYARTLFERTRNPYRGQLLEVIASKGDPDDFKMIMEFSAKNEKQMQGSEALLIKALSYYAGYGEIGGLRDEAIRQLTEYMEGNDLEVAEKASEAMIAAVGIWKVRLKTDYLTGKERETLRKEIEDWSRRLNIQPPGKTNP